MWIFRKFKRTGSYESMPTSPEKNTAAKLKSFWETKEGGEISDQLAFCAWTCHVTVILQECP